MTQKISSLNRLPYVKPGDQPSASHYNRLVANINNLVSSVKKKDELYMLVEPFALEDIPPYSIFTVDSVSSSKSEFDPLALAKAVDSADDSIFLATEDETILSAGSEAYVPIIGLWRPYLINYKSTDGDPTVGGDVGPVINTGVPNDFSVTVNGTGLKCVSPPDTTNHRVWVVAAGGGKGSLVYRGKPDSTILRGTNGTMNIWDSAGVTSPLETLEVTNPYNIDLDTQTWCRAVVVEGWAKPIIEPDYWTECVAPPNNVQGPIGS